MSPKTATAVACRRAVVLLRVMPLRKTVDEARGIYRIFEFEPGVFQVLNSEGRSVDELTVVEIGGCPGVSAWTDEQRA